MPRRKSKIEGTKGDREKATTITGKDMQGITQGQGWTYNPTTYSQIDKHALRDSYLSHTYSQPLFDISLTAKPRMSSTHHNTSYNATLSCIYPLSDQYALLPCWNYFALLLFTITFQRQKLLIQAALGSIITYAGVTTIHAFILLILTYTNPSGVVDLDIFGTFLILDVTTLVIWPLLHFNRVIGLPRLRRLMRFFFVGVAGGTIASGVALGALERPWGGGSCEVPFVPYKNDSNPVWGDPNVWLQEHCNVTCTDRYPLLRKESELQVFDIMDFMDDNGLLTAFRCFGIVAAVYTILSICLLRSDGKVRFSLLRLLPEKFLPSKQVIKALLLSQSGLQAGIAAMGPLAIILTELMLSTSPTIPQNESPRNVGQWACWAATLLLGVAAVVDWALERRKEVGDGGGEESESASVSTGHTEDSEEIKEKKRQLPGLRDYKEYKKRAEMV
jgi:hypothetical protein